MGERRRLPLEQFTRRKVIGLGATLIAGAMPTPIPTTAGQGSPVAPSATGGSLTHSGSLVDTDWLAANDTDPAVRIVGLMPADEFEAAHIPGSAQIDWPEFEVIDTSDASLVSWRAEIEHRLTDLGISPHHTVVVYDNGTLFSARLWWVLRYLDHADVRVLDGGFDAWQEAVEPVQASPAPEVPRRSTAYHGTPNESMLAQFHEVMGWLEDAGVVIVDARTADEYAAGHIPGAININYPLNAQASPPRYWKPINELRAMYEAAGVTTDRLVVPYCSSGVRSAVTAFTLHHIGYERVALYTGSWQEWSSVPTAPKTMGRQP